MARKIPTRQVVVIGLGRFGYATSQTLVEQHTEVLGIEKNVDLVQKASHDLTYVVQADATDVEALKELGVKEFNAAVIAVGTSIESSVLICANLVDLEVPEIWAKAISPAHGKILERIGATHVVYPEADAGVRVAHLISGHLLDFIEFEDDFAIVKMEAPQTVCGKSLEQSRIRSKYDVTIIGGKTPGHRFKYATPDAIIQPDDILIVSGSPQKIEVFASLP